MTADAPKRQYFAGCCSHHKMGLVFLRFWLDVRNANGCESFKIKGSEMAGWHLYNRSIKTGKTK